PAAAAGGRTRFETSREWSLAEIAAAQARAGDPRAALSTAGRIERAGTRLWALTAIAAALAGRR
ncbi:MAG: hypothetical protein OXP07_06500, partial [Defluviicoccus sp.]|nr:hypothetical protein [Defluviicoccus sp.]